jgi:hypothetical protein
MGRAKQVAENGPRHPEPRFWGEGSVFRVFKQMQILQRLLAPQNDMIRGIFPQAVKPGATIGRRATLRDSNLGPAIFQPLGAGCFSLHSGVD